MKNEFTVCVYVIINKRSFESFICLECVMIRVWFSVQMIVITDCTWHLSSLRNVRRYSSWWFCSQSTSLSFRCYALACEAYFRYSDLSIAAHFFVFLLAKMLFKSRIMDSPELSGANICCFWLAKMLFKSRIMDSPEQSAANYYLFIFLYFFSSDWLKCYSYLG